MPKPQRIEPKPGQESVWDFPRPPRLEKVAQRLRVIFGGETIADTTAGYRVLETSHPPVYYIPPGDLRAEYVHRAAGKSWCEFKGQAQYWTIDVNGRRSEKAAWSYANPSHAFADIAGYLAFYASRADECWVGNERVQAQTGDFYGGWITANVVGPFKGGAGTMGW
jgi:uncharacterized protein (DUF427 family)